MGSTGNGSDRIGDILIRQKAATRAQVEQALAQQQEKGGRLGALLIELGICTSQQVTRALGEQSGLEVVDLAETKVPTAVLEFVAREIADEHLILPLERADNTLKLAVADPYDLGTIDDLRMRLNTEISCVLADPQEIKAAIERNYGVSTEEEALQEKLETFTESDIQFNPAALEGGAGGGESETEDAPVIRLVTSIIVEAVKARASDIHIEPFEKRVRIRYRIDGICYEVERLAPPKRLQLAILSRIKIMSRMQIEEKRKPQDGQIKTNVLGKPLDLRVSVIPATYGESAVLRLLEKDAMLLGVQNLGFEEDDNKIFQSVIKRPNGIFLVTGPTGSGKTTTLYAALNELNRPNVKIITAEEPVEYHLSGINQSQVHSDIGFTFARILRAMLRQAPNIILVGEIRDKETAEIAIEAALTGHLVFSTLHTNDAPSAITRLIDIGVKAFLVASSLQGAMGQRLVRILCPKCREPYTPTTKEIFSMGMKPEQMQGRPIYRPKGCPECDHKGYRGRRGIFELMILNRRLRDLAFQRASAKDIRREARNGGMRTLRDDGIRKVLRGITTLDEVNRETHVGSETAS